MTMHVMVWESELAMMLRLCKNEISELFRCFISFYFTCTSVWNKTETNLFYFSCKSHFTGKGKGKYRFI